MGNSAIFIAIIAFIIIDAIVLMLVILLKHHKHKELSVAYGQLEDQLNERRSAEERLVQKRIELTAANEQLRGQITKLERPLKELARIKHPMDSSQVEPNREHPSGQSVELGVKIGQLQEQIGERQQAQDDVEQQRGQLEQRLSEQSDELAATNEQLQQARAQRRKAEKYIELQSTELESKIKELQDKIFEYQQAQDDVEQQRGQFAQRLSDQSDELTATNEQLQQATAERQRAEKRLVLLKTKLTSLSNPPPLTRGG